ncbi:carbohydrate ABC transporter ATP-binding protein [Burkholderia pseudomallei]|nr:carbohydrate ABC transporter ATP-binding protein [Burkholderia pseudomallei]
MDEASGAARAPDEASEEAMDTILALTGITKRFPGVVALRGIDLRVARA